MAGLTFALVALLSPLAYSLNMLWGFAGQLRTVTYPSEWQEARGFLQRQGGDFSVLFLPWHGFMTYSWAGNRVANPAPWFFPQRLITSQSIEVGPIETESTEPAQLYLGYLLKHQERIQNWGELLAPLNIRYIILAKEADYQQYGFLLKQADLKVVLENPLLWLLENQHPTPLLYSVDRSQPLADWEQAIRVLGQPEVDSLGAVFPLGSPGQPQATGQPQPVAYRRLSPVRYQVAPAQRESLVVALPYERWWRLGGKSPQANLGVNNAFSVAPDSPQLLSYGKSDILNAGYIISAVALVLTLALWFIFRGGVWGKNPS